MIELRGPVPRRPPYRGGGCLKYESLFSSQEAVASFEPFHGLSGRQEQPKMAPSSLAVPGLRL